MAISNLLSLLWWLCLVAVAAVAEQEQEQEQEVRDDGFPSGGWGVGRGVVVG